MKIDMKSLSLGVLLGVTIVLLSIFILGDVDTEVHFSTGNKRINKDIDIRIERVMENGQDLTNAVVKGVGDITREELEKELERMLKRQGIDKTKTKLKVEMEINS
tara:strand:+ start:451 stop:765 length:315 start_codon:yes stop_codon:yes gene_type:complete